MTTDAAQRKPSFAPIGIQGLKALRRTARDPVRRPVHDTSTARTTPFAKIRARVDGTRLTSEQLDR
jgi:hypothetical protein